MNLDGLVRNKVFQTLMVSLPSLISSFVVGICIVQVLGPEGKGALGLISFNIEMFVLILGLSIGSAITYFIANKKIRAGKIMTIALFVIAAGAFIVGATYMISDWLGYNVIIYSEEFLSPIVIFYFFLIYFITIIKHISIAFLQGFHKITWINQITLFTAIINFLIIVPLFIYMKYGGDLASKQNFEMVIELLMVANVIAALPILHYLRKIIQEKGLKPEGFKLKNDFFPLMRFAFIGHLSNIINFFNYRIDIWFISYFFFAQFDILSFYLVAVTLSQIIWRIPTAINLVYFPRLCENPSISLTIRISQLNTLLVSVVSIIGLLVAPYLIPKLYGGKFEASVFPFQLLLIGIFFSSLTKTIASFIFAKGKVNINLIATIVGLLVTLVLDYFLIPVYGIVGAAWATNITYFSIFLVCLTYIWTVAKKEGKGTKVLSLFVPGSFRIPTE